jgi:hypothetical protein
MYSLKSIPDFANDCEKLFLKNKKKAQSLEINELIQLNKPAATDVSDSGFYRFTAEYSHAFSSDVPHVYAGASRALG